MLDHLRALGSPNVRVRVLREDNLVEHHVERARPPRSAERRIPVEQQAPVVQLRAVADEPG